MEDIKIEEINIDKKYYSPEQVELLKFEALELGYSQEQVDKLKTVEDVQETDLKKILFDALGYSKKHHDGVDLMVRAGIKSRQRRKNRGLKI